MGHPNPLLGAYLTQALCVCAASLNGAGCKGLPQADIGKLTVANKTGAKLMCSPRGVMDFLLLFLFLFFI